MKYTKPYFGKDVEDRIVTVVQTELAKDNKTVDEAAIRRHVQARKNTYENAILQAVADGYYVASVIKDEIAYKVNPPSEKEIADVIERASQQDNALRSAGKPSPGVPTPKQVELAITNARAGRLSHAINMIALHGRSLKLGVEAVDVAPAAVESDEPTLETVTA